MRFLTDQKYKNLIYENAVAITLSQQNMNVFYYQSEGKSGLSFVIQNLFFLL